MAMQFTVAHADLLPALAQLTRTAPTHPVRPVLSAIGLVAAENTLTLSATDLETAAVTRLPAAVAEEGAAALPARYLHEAVRRVPSGEVRFQGIAGGSGARIQWGTGHCTIHGFSPADFPSIPPFPEAPERTMTQGALRRIIQRTAFAAAQGETGRALLTGVELRFGHEGVFALATDGFQVASYATHPAVERPENGAVVVPATVLLEVARSLAEGDAPCDIARDGNRLLFRFGSMHVATRLLEGKYFAVLDMVPKVFPTVARVDRDVLTGACERVGLISDNEAPYAVSAAFAPGEIRLSAASPDVGEAEEAVPAEVEGPQLIAGFNGRQLIHGLRRLEGNVVHIELSGAQTLARFTTPADPCLQYMQMPLHMPGSEEGEG